MKLKPKNWAVFQHYKNRMPPWIKFHRNLLIDREYMSLPIASKAIAPLLWLLASESQDGSFDASIAELKFRLHLTEKEIEIGLKPLIDKGFFYYASKMLADCQQDACLETEREKEKEVEKEAKKESQIGICPPNVSTEVWEEFISHRKSKKAKVTQLVINGIVKEANKAGWPVEDALKEVIIRNWQSFKAEWVAAKQNPADVVRHTVPSKQERDPELVRLEEERKLAVKPNPEMMAKLKQFTNGMKL